MKIKDIIAERERLMQELLNLPKPKVVAYTAYWNERGHEINYKVYNNDNIRIQMKRYECDNDDLHIECDGMKYLSFFLYESKPDRPRLGLSWDDINLNSVDEFLTFCSDNFWRIEDHKQSESIWSLLDTLQEANFEIVKQILSTANAEL